jgi:hypothetical protein
MDGMPMTSPSHKKTELVAGLEPLKRMPFVERSYQWRGEGGREME